MKELKYTTLEDIKEFLKTLNYKWNGNIKVLGKVQPATIENFEFNANLIVKNIKTNKYKHMLVSASDHYFHIAKDNPKIKYDVINHSIAWQAFMIERKSKSYAKYIYKKAIQEKQKLENEYNNEINLLEKRTEFLKFKKSLRSAALNTTIFNAENKLKQNKEFKVDNQKEKI